MYKRQLLTNVYSKPLILHVINAICKSEIENIYVISGSDHKKINGPIGLGINAKSPAEIAVSIISQIIQVKNNMKHL